MKETPCICVAFCLIICITGSSCTVLLTDVSRMDWFAESLTAELLPLGLYIICLQRFSDN